MEQIIKKIEAEKLIVILRGIKKEHLINVTNAMYEGGVKLLEITYSANGSVSDEETAENIKLLHDAFGDKISIGAGTVLTEKQVRFGAAKRKQNQQGGKGQQDIACSDIGFDWQKYAILLG